MSYYSEGLSLKESFIKKIEEYPGYFITRSAQVYSNKSGRLLRLKQIINAGYLKVTFYGKNKKQPRYVHRFLAKYFLPNWDPELTVNHLNGIKTDNRLSNLEMCTQSQNVQHAFDTGLTKPSKGVDRHNSVLNRDIVLFIRENYPKISQTELARMFCCGKNTVRRVVKNITWRHIK